jgi:hypothetical protein
MAKLMAVVRTLFLVFVSIYAVKELPIALFFSSDARRGDVMVPYTKIRDVSSVAWLAIAWIAVEVVVGWSHVWVSDKLRARAAARAARAAPPAPPSPPPPGPAA